MAVEFVNSVYMSGSTIVAEHIGHIGNRAVSGMVCGNVSRR